MDILNKKCDKNVTNLSNQQFHFMYNILMQNHLKNKPQYNFSQNTTTFFPENVFENVCKVSQMHNYDRYKYKSKYIEFHLK